MTNLSKQQCIHRAGCPKPEICGKVGHCTSMTATDLLHADMSQEDALRLVNRFSKKESFRAAPRLQTPEIEGHPTVDGDHYVALERLMVSTGKPIEFWIHVESARALRDWLTCVLPESPVETADKPACAGCGIPGTARCPHCEAVTCGDCATCEHYRGLVPRGPAVETLCEHCRDGIPRSADGRRHESDLGVWACRATACEHAEPSICGAIVEGDLCARPLGHDGECGAATVPAHPHEWLASAALGYKHCLRCPAKWLTQDDPEPVGCSGVNGEGEHGN